MKREKRRAMYLFKFMFLDSKKEGKMWELLNLYNV